MSRVEKRYRWVAEHLVDMRSFIKKTGRFEDKLKTAEEGKKTKASNAKQNTKEKSQNEDQGY